MRNRADDPLDYFAFLGPGPLGDLLAKLHQTNVAQQVVHNVAVVQVAHFWHARRGLRSLLLLGRLRAWRNDLYLHDLTYK